MIDTKTLLTRYQPREVGKPTQPEQQLAVIRFSPCGKVLAAGDMEGNVRRWQLSGDVLTPMPPLTGSHGWVQALAFDPLGKLLYAADSWGRLVAWPFLDKEPRPAWALDKAHDGWIRKVAVSPDGKTLATCSSDGVVRTWAADKGTKRREWSAGIDVLSLAFHPDSKSIAFGDLKGGIAQHDIETGKPIRRFEAKEMYRLDRIQDVGGVRCLAFDRAGTQLLAGGCVPITGGFVQGAGSLLFFDASTGKMKQSLKIGEANDGYVHDAHWHKDGFAMAVTSGQPGTGKLVFHRPSDAAPFFIATKMPNCQSLAVHPDGRRLVVAATNANSSGNGRNLTKERNYPANTTPLWMWQLPV